MKLHFNHVQLFFLCLFSFPILIVIVWALGESIDQFFSSWERQFIFFMVVLLIVGGTWFGKKLRG
jgi:amino acid permease